jgi:hypothetical protein
VRGRQRPAPRSAITSSTVITMSPVPIMIVSLSSAIPPVSVRLAASGRDGRQ